MACVADRRVGRSHSPLRRDVVRNRTGDQGIVRTTDRVGIPADARAVPCPRGSLATIRAARSTRASAAQSRLKNKYDALTAACRSPATPESAIGNRRCRTFPRARIRSPTPRSSLSSVTTADPSWPCTRRSWVTVACGRSWQTDRGPTAAMAFRAPDVATAASGVRLASSRLTTSGVQRLDPRPVRAVARLLDGGPGPAMGCGAVAQARQGASAAEQRAGDGAVALGSCRRRCRSSRTERTQLMNTSRPYRRPSRLDVRRSCTPCRRSQDSRRCRRRATESDHPLLTLRVTATFASCW